MERALNFILPIAAAAIFGGATMVILDILFNGTIRSDFLAGWWSCLLFTYLDKKNKPKI